MDVKYVNPFIVGLQNTFQMLNMTSINRVGIAKREKLKTDNEVNIIIGMVGDLKGNVVLSLPETTARNIASTMMGGMPVPELDLMPKSALCELSNMVTGSSMSQLEGMGVAVNITPPMLINGKNLVTMISQVETLVISFSCNEGPLEMNIATE